MPQHTGYRDIFKTLRYFQNPSGKTWSLKQLCLPPAKRKRYFRENFPELTVNWSHNLFMRCCTKRSILIKEREIVKKTERGSCDILYTSTRTLTFDFRSQEIAVQSKKLHNTRKHHLREAVHFLRTQQQALRQ